jgi:type I restriction enzyme R subunit
MALIVSPGQNEIEQMKKHGLDIEPHRKRMNDEALDEKFKDSSDPLRIVFLCAMWLTGFDAPSCSTVYLDKPMRNHTLMQTIARANRVFPGKHSGMIVDYANVFASLEKALAIYGAGKGGANPVKDKQKLVEELRKAVAAATEFCAAREVNLTAIEQLTAGGMERLQRIDDAVNALISPDPLRREFFGHERLVATLYNAVKPDPSAVEFSGRVACIIAIAAAIRTKLNPDRPDITEVMGDIAKLLDASITGVGIACFRWLLEPSTVFRFRWVLFWASSRSSFSCVTLSVTYMMPGNRSVEPGVDSELDGGVGFGNGLGSSEYV